jgi:hypothetical protein
MAQPSYVELQTGSGRHYRIAVCMLWLLATGVVIAHVQVLAWPLSAVASSLLVLLWPGMNDPLQRTRRLFLYRNGAAALDDLSGTWGAQSWSCRWFSMLRIDRPDKTLRILVSARRNRADDYRRLLVWIRFPPFNAARGGRRPGQAC